jgi:putative DNA primase/helicase
MPGASMTGLDRVAAAPIWLRWKLEPNENGKLTKVPYSPHGAGQASHTKPSDWGTLAEAKTALKRWGGSGVGAVATAIDDQYVHACLDVDGCFAPDSDERGNWVDPIAAILDGCYCEASVSGTGLHFHFLIRREVVAMQRWRINAKRPSPDGRKDHGFELAVLLRGGYYLTASCQGDGELRVLEEPELQALYDCIKAFQPPKERKAHAGKAAASSSADPDRHTRTLAAIAALANDGRFVDRDEWVKIGMAVHDGTDGSAAGLRGWLVWTERLHPDAENSCSRAWATFSPGGGTTVATLFKFARADGWQDPQSKQKRKGHDQEPPPDRGDGEPDEEAGDGALAANEATFLQAVVAQEFVEQQGEEFRYVATRGQWFHWTGRCWEHERTELVFNLIARLFAARSFDTGRKIGASDVHGAEAIARSQRAVARLAEDFNTHLNLINHLGGTFDMLTEETRPWRRDDYLTQCCTATPQGSCPQWLKFLNRITADDLDLQAYLARVVGYGLTGFTGEHVLFDFFGEGRNGKTTFIEVIAAVLGPYARSAISSTFVETRNEAHPTGIADFEGYRLVYTTEVGAGQRWNTELIKRLTGGDTMSARRMRQDFFTYVPQCKLVISGNHKLNLRRVDTAIRARIHLIPFTVVIPEAERDKDLKAKLLAERDGVLAWALKGCLDWHQRGLDPPPVVGDATEAYFDTQDATGRWLAECCETGKPHSATAADLYLSWKRWSTDNGESPASKKTLGIILDERGFPTDKTTGGVRRRHGLRLTTEEALAVNKMRDDAKTQA